MKVLSRDFTFREKVLLTVIAIVLLGLGYYFFIDQPVRTGIATAKADYELYSDQYYILENKIARLEEMKQEMADMSANTSRMPSYNASKQEIDLLNNVLAPADDYSIAFTGITRTGNQIRRSFTLQFVAPDYLTARNLLSKLENSENRCMIADVYFSRYSRDRGDAVTVSASAVFYETMVGGTPDSGLPADSSSTGTNTDN